MWSRRLLLRLGRTLHADHLPPRSSTHRRATHQKYEVRRGSGGNGGGGGAAAAAPRDDRRHTFMTRREATRGASLKRKMDEASV